MNTKIDPDARSAVAEWQLESGQDERHAILTGEHANSLYDYRMQIARMAPLSPEEQRLSASIEYLLEEEERLMRQEAATRLEEIDRQTYRHTVLTGHDPASGSSIDSSARYRELVNSLGELSHHESMQFSMRLTILEDIEAGS